MAATSLESLRAERDRYVALAFSWGDLLFEVDHDLTIAFAAGATEAFVGRRPGELRGACLRDLVAPADGPLIAQTIKSAARTHRIDSEVVRLRTPQGSFIPVSLSGYCLDPVLGKYYLAMRKGTADAVAHPRPGTLPHPHGLHDADGFAQIASQRLKELGATGEQAEVTMVAIPGIDDLGKRLDDPTRTRLLNEVAETLRFGSVGGNSAAQVGEGRYSLIHAVGADIGALIGKVQEVARSHDPTGEGAQVLSTTLPMGDVAAVSAEDLAKGLMYAMNRFREAQGADFSLKSLSNSIGSLVETAARDVNDFRTVVSKAQFDVALQPIVDVDTGEIHHYEALCRFHADAGESPYRTIAFAEETGLIPDFDLAMIRKVVALLSHYPRNSDRLRVAVNVSGRSIGHERFVGELHALLRADDWTQGKLLFEITESARMTDLEGANRFIQGLRQWGYEVCLDDFGAGAASFQYLATLEVDVVKLDGSAVRNAQRAAKGRAFLSALTELCRRLGVRTIAEMIDSPESLSFVRECGCDFAQGYLFGKPAKNVKDFDPLPMKRLFRQPVRAR